MSSTLQGAPEIPEADWFEPAESVRREFADRLVRITDADVKRLALWTRAVGGDRPKTRAEWRQAVSRELNSVRAHPAELKRRAALESLGKVIEGNPARAEMGTRALDRLVAERIDARHRVLSVRWAGQAHAKWTIAFAIVVILTGVAFLAAAVGTGLGGRRELMSLLALIAFALIGIAMAPYVAMPLLPPTRNEGMAALWLSILATGVVELLPETEYRLLMEPWQQGVEDGELPPRSWATAVAAGRLLIAVITIAAGGYLAIGFLGQLRG
jgi:hypothetical protein